MNFAEIQSKKLIDMHESAEQQQQSIPMMDNHLKSS
jgi:hypothetical protein